MRLLSSFLALAILATALFRVVRNSFSSRLNPTRESGESTSVRSRGVPEGASWRPKNLLLLPLPVMDQPIPVLKRNEEVVLLQVLASGEHCSVGHFTFLAARENHMVLRSSLGRRPSNLESWARQKHTALKWQIIKPSADLKARPYLQKCERWLSTGTALAEIKIVSARSELFLSSKDFLAILPASKANSLSINADVLRGGWRVSSPQGGWQALLVLDAQTGLKQNLSVHFPNQKAPLISIEPPRRNKELSKPIALPGWD
ncbi:MAG: hypothetical protein FJY29_06090 [Betaproteobacteria bacterium]|nr:hypothetical protein [Betaproteobacteria bacterium]